MMWLFLILALSAAIVVSVGIAMYLRVRRQMRASGAALRGTLDEVDPGGQTGKL
jgi:hypothetical protein